MNTWSKEAKLPKEISSVKTYVMRLRKWARYAAGSSYQHVEQGRGKLFIPDRLDGYFNDLQGKAVWTGNVDPLGVPLVNTDTTRNFPFPIAIFQWGLGNWDKWLASGNKDDEALHNAVSAGLWAQNSIDSRGGWRCWDGLRRPVTSVYSAMAQGEGLSLLSRLAYLNHPGLSEIRDCCQRAYALLVDIPGEGLLVEHYGSAVLEEYPGGELAGVLNGWIFALAGVRDFALLSNRSDVIAFAEECAAGISTLLPRYDLGYWSNYDLAGNVASPFYHSLHIAQLRALADMFPAQAANVLAVAERFEKYQASRLCKVRAILIKILQKLKQTQMGEIE